MVKSTEADLWWLKNHVHAHQTPPKSLLGTLVQHAQLMTCMGFLPALAEFWIAIRSKVRNSLLQILTAACLGGAAGFANEIK